MREVELVMVALMVVVVVEWAVFVEQVVLV